MSTFKNFKIYFTTPFLIEIEQLSKKYKINSLFTVEIKITFLNRSLIELAFKPIERENKIFSNFGNGRVKTVVSIFHLRPYIYHF